MYRIRWAFALGLLILLTAPLTIVTSGSTVIAGVRALVGLGFIGVWFALNQRRLFAPKPQAVAAEGTDAEKRAMGGASRATFFFLTTALISVVAVGLLAGVNFIVNKRDKTWDLTTKKIWSLAPQTESTLKELKQPVKAVGFIGTTDVQRDALEHFLKRYAQLSEKFTYELKDPEKSPDLVNKYQVRPGSPTVVLIRGEGANESHTAVSLTQLARGGAEQELTNALIKLDRVGEQKVYFTTGHGEWPIDSSGPELDRASAATEFKASLVQEGYAPESLNLLEKKNEIPKDAAALVIAGAKSAFSATEVAAVDKYLEGGGRLLYFADDKGEPGLDGVLAKYGVQVDKGFVADQLSADQPYMIICASFGQHEITRLQRVNTVFPTVHGLSQVTQGQLPGTTVTALALSLPTSWEETNPDSNPQPDQGEKVGPISVVMASEHALAGSTPDKPQSTRLVVFGDADVLVDANWGQEGNRNLILNSVAWATQQTTRITIRPPDRDISTLDLDEQKMLHIRFVAIDLLPSLLVGIGLALWIVRRNK